LVDAAAMSMLRTTTHRHEALNDDDSALQEYALVGPEQRLSAGPATPG
jgi:hypothetical protein